MYDHEITRDNNTNAIVEACAYQGQSSSTRRRSRGHTWLILDSIYGETCSPELIAVLLG